MKSVTSKTPSPVCEAGYQARVLYSPVRIVKSRDRRKQQRWVLNKKAFGSRNLPFAYWAFTGWGGLHGLKRKDFNDFEEYTKAKQRYEHGTFFTPDNICRLIVEMLEIEPGSVVADICSGKGSFFNYLSDCKLYGVEKTKDVWSVSKKLFPKAHIQLADMRGMKPIPPCDYIVGNPPYNVPLYVPKHPFSFKDGKVLSQNYYLAKCFDCLKKGGFLAFVCPNYSKTGTLTANQKVARYFRDNFNMIAAITLPQTAFLDSGTNTDTKILIVQKKKGNEKPGMEFFQAKYESRDQVLRQWRNSTQYKAFKELKLI